LEFLGSEEKTGSDPFEILEELRLTSRKTGLTRFWSFSEAKKKRGLTRLKFWKNCVSPAEKRV
jgi:hypothetical protein